MLRNIIIEGVDRLGKDTLIQGLKQKLGFFQTVHYQKPEILEAFINQAKSDLGPIGEIDIKRHAQKLYQMACFKQMFIMLSGEGSYILNRAHLGEVVYSPRYRGYTGDYVFELEKSFPKAAEQSLLVILHTSDFDFIKDDGLSFDFDKKEEEQNDFLRAADRSNMTYKLLIDVNDGRSNFVRPELIVNTVIYALKELPNLQHPNLTVRWVYEAEDSTTPSPRYHLYPDPKKSVV